VELPVHDPGRPEGGGVGIYNDYGEAARRARLDARRDGATAIRLHP
jgi:hypothetical protein